MLKRILLGIILAVLLPLFSASSAAWAGSGETDWEAANRQISFALEQGDIPAALRAAEEAARIAQSSFGPNHMKTAVALKKLADVQRLTGDVKSSALSLDQAAKLWKTNLGAKHPYSSEVLIEAARDRSAAKDWEGAIAEFRKALDTQRAYYGKQHTVVATTLQELARVQREAGRQQDSFHSESEAAGILFAALPPGHPRTLAAFQELSAHEAERGNTRFARKELKRALDAAALASQSFPQPLASAYVLNGDLAFQDGDSAVAEESYQKAIELLRPLGADLKTQRLTVLYKLRELYQSAGRDELASRTADQAHQLETAS